MARLLSELQRSNKELEQFAYVASHDLQEPLRMIASYVQLLEQKYKGRLDEKADKYIYFAVDGALRMQNLIEALLAYSRVTTRGVPLGPVDTNQTFTHAVADLSAAIEENRATVTKDQLPMVRGDEAQLAQLFQNLIGNAIKFRKPDIPPLVHVSAKKHGKEWLFSVRDNGIGVEPKYFDRIFQIFQRLHTHKEYPGTGIGLAICKRIVERHGGRIWLESAPGEGATFFFTLPATGEDNGTTGR
jgi:light-regulated signal transduction histidine kinase (bacteriophytochrome)